MDVEMEVEQGQEEDAEEVKRRAILEQSKQGHGTTLGKPRMQ
jgi:hypothetical protein